MKTNHYYIVTSIIDGNRKTYRRKFKTRPLADNFVCHLVYVHNVQVEDIRRTSKHVEEDYCDAKNKFIVARV